MSDVIVYEKRTCTTCRKVADLLRSRGIEYDDVQYHDRPCDSGARRWTARV
jgi:arsenate reductase-like glutaredoxin family protein